MLAFIYIHVVHVAFYVLKFIKNCFLQYVKKSLTPESANFITSIVALGHIAKMCPTEFAVDVKAIVSKTIVKDLLMMDRVNN